MTADDVTRKGNGDAKGSAPPPTVQHRWATPLHGRYLGYIRQLKSRQRAEVRAVREKKGIRAAIKKARTLAAG